MLHPVGTPEHWWVPLERLAAVLALLQRNQNVLHQIKNSNTSEHEQRTFCEQLIRENDEMLNAWNGRVPSVVS